MSGNLLPDIFFAIHKKLYSFAYQLMKKAKNIKLKLKARPGHH